MHYIEYCEARGIQNRSPLGTTDFYAQLEAIARNRSAVLADIENAPVRQVSRTYGAIQRLLDVCLSCLGLIVGSIPFLIIAIAVKIDSSGPILYRQARVGRHGSVFRMLKFRTMRCDAEQTTGPIWATALDPRLTRVGSFLRRFRLDEMPQLFNILIGDMTFVGPRPERPEFVYQFARYMPAFNRRHEVKPGIAGIAQMMNGYDTSAISVYRKIRWDMQYLKKRCLTTDLCILYRTVIGVLRGDIE